LLRYLDLYGKKPDLLYKGDSSCKTAYGGVVTLMAMACYVLCICLNVWRYFERSSPETNVNKLFVQDPVGFNATKDSFPFAFGLQDQNGAHFIDDSYYKPEANYLKYTKSIVNGDLKVARQVIPLTLITCDQVPLDGKYFDNLDLKSMHCIKEYYDSSFKHHLEITGEWESNTLGIIQLFIKSCKGAGCKPEADVISKVKSSYFALNYIGSTIKSSNYSDPIERFPSGFFTTISNMFSKQSLFRMADNQIDTQASPFGYVTPETINFTHVGAISTDYVQFAQPSDLVDTLIDVQIRMMREKTLTNRAYKTVFQYLAELGGLFNVITVVTLLLTARVGHTLMLIDLAKLNYFSHLATSFRKPQEQQSQGNKMEAEGQSDRNSSLKQGVAIFKRSVASSSQIHLDNSAKMKWSLSRPHGIQDSNKKPLAMKYAQIAPSDIKTPGLVSQDQVPIHHKSQLHESPDLQRKSSDWDIVNQGEKSPALVQKTPANKQTEDLSSYICNLIAASKRDFERELLKQGSQDLRSKKVSSGSILLHSFMPFLLPSTSKLRAVINTTEQQATSKFDFLCLLDIINDVHKLKLLLLSPDQRLLFDILPQNPVETEDHKNLSLQRAAQEERTLGAFQQRAETAYRKILNKHDFSRIDEELIYRLAYIFEDSNKAVEDVRA